MSEEDGHRDEEESHAEYSQQTQRLEPIERPHRDAPQPVIAQDSLHTQ